VLLSHCLILTPLLHGNRAPGAAREIAGKTVLCAELEGGEVQGARILLRVRNHHVRQ
jgi:hypothetical protein